MRRRKARTIRSNAGVVERVRKHGRALVAKAKLALRAEVVVRAHAHLALIGRVELRCRCGRRHALRVSKQPRVCFRAELTEHEHDEWGDYHEAADERHWGKK